MRIPTFAGALALATCLACASTPPPRSQIAAAEAALRDAETAQAQTLATPEWNTARDKLERARRELRDENYTTARELADEALVEAQLAAAVARSEAARKSSEAMQQTIRDLRDETDRASERVIP
ncbi:MAG: hypothetical protein DCC71_03255 [Proteobacteria bacterium]|nr:MAG: hypothetical protein DCC71_03255 [Pseudomonadota bacterium]